MPAIAADDRGAERSDGDAVRPLQELVGGVRTDRQQLSVGEVRDPAHRELERQRDGRQRQHRRGDDAEAHVEKELVQVSVETAASDQDRQVAKSASG